MKQIKQVKQLTNKCEHEIREEIFSNELAILADDLQSE